MKPEHPGLFGGDTVKPVIIHHTADYPRPPQAVREAKRRRDLKLALVMLVPAALIVGALIPVVWLANGFMNPFFTQKRGLGDNIIVVWRYTGPDGLLRTEHVRLKTFRIIKLRTLNRKGYAPLICWFLRKTKLDELPQVWNVLWGEMSFVGARPLKIEDARRIQYLWELDHEGMVNPALLADPGIFEWDHWLYSDQDEQHAHMGDAALVQLEADTSKETSRKHFWATIWKNLYALVTGKICDKNDHKKPKELKVKTS